MGPGTFKGGIHPYEGKELSKDKPVKVLMPKGDLVFPVSQHIGAPAAPCVAVGDRVLKGQMIAKAGGFVSSSIFSSVSGTVKAIEPRRVANGSKVNSIIIENDGQYELAEGVGVGHDPDTLSKEEIRKIIADAGIVGMGGAGFPTHVKLTPGDDSKIDYVIVNGAECEPYLTSDYRMLLEEPEKVIGGLEIILKLFEKAVGVIAIEDNKPDAIARLTEMVKGVDRVSVMAVKTKYPEGAERCLINAVSGRELNSTMLPAHVGCVVDNEDTVLSIYEAVVNGLPLMQRVFTVSGDAVKDPRNFKVLLGTSYLELIEAAGGFTEDPEKVLSGGPMMGMALYELDIPVVKTSSALTALKKDKVAAGLTTACIRCGRCIDACPSLLVPERLMEASIRNDLDAFEALHGMECVNCGSCSYVCPAKRPLAQSFTATKNALAARNRARAAAAKAEAEAKARAEAEAAAKAEGTDKKGDEK